MKLPDFPDLSADRLEAVSRRFGGRPLTRLPEVGIFNAVFALGDDLILRVPRDDPKFAEALERESRIIPMARAAGVRTPDLIVFEEDHALFPWPFVVLERVPGTHLAALDLEPEAVADVWRELGADYARLHAGVLPGADNADLVSHDLPDPREMAARCAEEGHYGPSEVRWLDRWLARLEEAARTDHPRRFLHGDPQATNVMVDPAGPRYRAVIDWGAATWGDPAWDFAGVPLRAVPFMLEGYRAQGLLDPDPSLEARILRRQLQVGLFLLGRGPAPGRSWAERSAGVLLEVLRFLTSPQGAAWNAWIS
ncbi:aminoglycoside phosphotransferase (APT) family kinase protein [Deinobacterium chartae]|uniref:Aminoglycoside phosphotransferase (APT) family kinase protein n=1 Tax=Deinobacterium chartae TaxID=521158 RepID=A0A841I2L3_9DEIO|nr:phosphotransferase [Deinobacterium chartae]MBB6099244.1 aminoglycoside phosphotransferase (APT) family kinase protein [Deinobacterium chartae]